MIRTMTRDDENFVVKSWLKSNRRRWNDVSLETYNRGYGGRILKCIERGRVLIMTHPDDPSFIVGFACHHGETLDYVYIRRDLRQCGFGRTLINECGQLKRTHTRSGFGMFTHLEWDPFSGP